MTAAARYRRGVAGAGLVATAGLMAVAMGTDVPFSGDSHEVLVTMAQARGRAWLSILTYLVAQLAMIAGVLGVARLLRPKAPALSNAAATLVVLGAFGHSVHGGGVLLIMQMAADQSHHATHATVLDAFAASPAGIFSAAGLLGTVLGLVVLAVGIWRARLGPRWIAPALGAFLVLEFVGSGVLPAISAVAGAVNLAAFVALALVIWRSSLDEWLPRGETRREAVASGAIS